MNRFIIHGHRGSRGTHPENTLPSFAEAYSAKAEFVELDVHLTRDDIPVVYHDSDLTGKICTDDDGKPLTERIPIRELNFKELQRYYCGDLPQSLFPEQKQIPGLHIPSLEELILWQKKQAPSLRLNIEIKRDDPIRAGSAAPELLAEKVFALADRYKLLQSSLFQSFDSEVLHALRAQNDKICLSHLFEDQKDFVAVAKAVGTQVISPYFKFIDAQLVKDAKQAKLDLLTWTVNESVDWENLYKLGVSSIITDFPRKLSDWVKTANST